MPATDTCLAAMRSRDRRFDGRFYTGVHTTGIYCRPSCPAMTPRAENVTFYPSAAAAQQAGFRACRRCRPDAVPGSPEWDERGDVAGRMMRLIQDGALDRGGLGELASRLGYSVRQLQRLSESELGASPIALARVQRSHTARLLIETTSLPLADVAFAAGFGSIRSFNDAIRTTYALTPSQLRSSAAGAPSHSGGDGALTSLSLRLPVRQPFEPGNVFGHLHATGVPGVEEWRDGCYRRAVAAPHGEAIVQLAPPSQEGATHLAATVWVRDLRDVTPTVQRLRRMFDLDADPVAIDEALGADPALAPLVAAAQGRRVPRNSDAEEFALRAVIGQQVSTAAARTHAGRLVQRYGAPIQDPAGGLTHLFPTAEALTGLDDEDLAGPATRRRTLQTLARALAEGAVDLAPGCDWHEARKTLGALPGIGPWTVEMVAMRGLGDPDALPLTDLAVARALTTLGVTPADTRRWSPWRSYATQHLWATQPHAVNHLPEETP